ncbi:SAM-dependent methyltransferase [Paracidovorax avenae]|uniref:class I SAM-dependent methyltransferase n=1 Tax=Paracidovorax avenae TaxID=80867 RepID=UPI000D21C5D4|nr:class I SAM-dependent methyltransferase [Paracidovorax avenae]AVS65046.1 SAM-dependent methyltransferase [Paracidovorax avenae]
MEPQNAQQIADWNGPSGERWIVNQARLDSMLAEFGQAAIDAAAPVAGERVLDIGCGTGTTSFALAALVGAQGRVLGVDVSVPLIERARALAPPDETVQFQVADASSAELPDGAFDLLFSRFGVMFFDDPARAFAHLRRALKPGGRVALVCWRRAAENEWVRLPMAAIEGLVPSTVPSAAEAPGPFSFADQGRVLRILTTAGFAEIALAPLDASIPFGQGEARDAALDDAVRLAVDAGPLARVLAEQPDDIRVQAAAAVRTAFAALPVGQSVMTGGAAWIVTARNPLHPSQDVRRASGGFER